jgi:hypothetical protein
VFTVVTTGQRGERRVPAGFGGSSRETSVTIFRSAHDVAVPSIGRTFKLMLLLAAYAAEDTARRTVAEAR